MKNFKNLNLKKHNFTNKEIKNYTKQRITKGFCDFDLWDMDEWFLEIIPNMLKTINSKYLGFPNCMIHEYFEENKEKYSKIIKKGFLKKDVEEAKKYCSTCEDIMTYLFEIHSKDNKKRLEEFRAEVEKECEKRWHNTLNKIINLFICARGGGYDQKSDKIKAAIKGLDLFKKYFFYFNW